jgi:hypothetical protein
LATVEERFRLAVIRIRQLAVLELDDGWLAVDDIGDPSAYGFVVPGSSFVVRVFVVRGLVAHERRTSNRREPF